ncbi:MAG: hypothetical protein ACT4O3_05040, partial [Elusimicrobiota bacterium]
DENFRAAAAEPNLTAMDWLKHNWKLKLISLALAILLWLVLHLVPPAHDPFPLDLLLGPPSPPAAGTAAPRP